MIHYLATTNCLSISLAAVSVGMIMFTPIAEAMLAIPLMTKFHAAYSYHRDRDMVNVDLMRYCESSVLVIGISLAFLFRLLYLSLRSQIPYAAYLQALVLF